MGQLLSKTLYYKSGTTQPDPKKACGTLSTGAIAYMEGDPNSKRDDNVSGSGTQQMSLYVISADRTTISNPVSFSYSDVSGVSYPWLPRWSMCVDASNNVHCVYIYSAGTSGQQSLRYRKATYSAGSYTWGAEVVVSAYAANKVYGGIDIDIPSTTVDYPMIVASTRSGTSGSYTFALTVYNKTSSGWNTQAMPINATQGGNTADVSIACEQDAPSGGETPTYVVTHAPGPVSTGMVDPGDSVFSHRAAVGGAFSGSVFTVNTGLAKTLNSNYRNYWAFYLTADWYIVYGEQQSSPEQYWWTIFKVASSNGAVTVGVGARTGSHSLKGYRPAYALGAASLYRIGNGNFALSSYLIGQTGPWRADIFLTYDGTKWSYREPSTCYLPNDGLYSSATIKMVYGYDSSRFANGNSLMCIVHYVSQGTTYAYKSYIYTKSHLQTVSQISVPTESQTVGTNQISSKVSVVYTPVSGDQKTPVSAARVQIQLSTSSTFVTTLYTATQDVSQEKQYASTAISVDVDLSAYPLSQQVWYMRARMVDSFGNFSAWSSVRSFRISHPARPTNAQPGDQGVVAYITNYSIFSWEFSDSFPADYQTAYQMVVKNASGTVVYDSGKQASAAVRIALDLGSSNLEQYFDWYVTLWDSENVAGPQTYIGNFLFTGLPSPSWVTPASENAVLTTAVPVIGWTSGVGGVKTQSGFRVVIRQGSTLVYDSNIRFGTDTSFQVPMGYLHNANTYQIDLQILDSAGLGATITRTFQTAWSSPSQPAAPLVFPRHDTHGYVAVSVDETGIDATCIQYNVYRRTLDRLGSNWTLVAVSTDLSGSFVFLDYLCPGGVMNEYMVTQVADRFGDAVESTFLGAPVTQYASTSSSFWLIDINEPKRSCKIPNATSHSYNDAYEKTDYVVINGGRQVEEGEHQGITGTVSSQIRPNYNSLGGSDIYNLVANPNLLLNAGALIDQYTTFDSGSQLAALSFLETSSVPGPGNRGNKKLGLSVSKAVANGNQISAGIQDSLASTPYMSFVTGRQYNLSGWVNIPAVQAGYAVNLRLQWYNGATLVSTEQATLSSDLSSGSTISESIVLGTDLWTRISRICTVPAGANNCVVSVQIVSVGTTVLPPLTVYVEGVQLTNGPALVPYFSGDQINNAIWLGTPNVDPSYSPGYVSPRYMKQNLEWLRRSGHDLYIRTPFGDIWKVYVNDLDISNVAGTGSTEFVDMTIPYLQVR